MIWSRMSIGGRMVLHVVQNGILVAQRFTDEILRPHAIPYSAAIVDFFILMHGNVRSSDHIQLVFGRRFFKLSMMS